MKIKNIHLGELATNCYIISTKENNAVVIDCGDEAEKVLSYTVEEGLTIKKILLTHGHFDHIGAVAEIAQKTDAQVFIHELDKPMLSGNASNLAGLLPSFNFKPIIEATTIEDGDTIVQDELTFKVIHTPGHTKGGVCYLCGGSIFTGDTLFYGDVGRTDFPGGNYNEIINSVKRLAMLDGDYKVFPGHGMASSLERERNFNSYIKG